MKTHNVLITLSIVLLSSIFVSCSKDNDSVPVQFLLTDNPAAYDEVNVNIVGIEVKVSKDTTKWYSIQTNAGVYNLLNFQNGITTVIAQGNVPNAILKEVRFILGSNNTIKVNGQVYSLRAPSAEDSGLKIKIDKNLGLTLNTFTLDFDAATSVKEESPGVYKLQPSIKLK